MPASTQATRERIVLAVLFALAIISVVAFMVVGAKGSWAFVLKLRGRKISALLLVAYTVAVSTILFQTVTNNRILTPSIMGFDSLYVLVKTLMVFLIGSADVAMLDPRLRFLGETALLIVFAGLLYRWLFAGGERSLHLLMLSGIIFGLLFRSLSGFLQRILDPNEFMVLQDSLFASFNTVNPTLLGISASIVVVASLIGLRLMHTLDVLSLGRPAAINLGIEYKSVVTSILMIVAVMVAVSTALVGPVMFFGLLVTSLAGYLIGTGKHRLLLPTGILVAIICLVGGQVIVERVFAFDTALSIIIEFVGGILFIALVLRRGVR